MTEIKACPRCGSQRIFMGELKGGVIYGLTSWKMQCRNCGYQGQPLIFDTQEEYEKFLEGLKETRGADVPPLGPEDEQPDKNIQDLLANTPDQKPTVEAPEKSWRLEIIVAIIIGAVLTIFEIPSFVNSMGATGVVYAALFLVIASLVALVVIIFVEYVYRKLKSPAQDKKR